MKLYDLVNKTRVIVTDMSVMTPPASIPVELGDVLEYINVDGMYARCKNENGDFVYPASGTNIKVKK